jgi:hypothetical protein
LFGCQEILKDSLARVVVRMNPEATRDPSLSEIESRAKEQAHKIGEIREALSTDEGKAAAMKLVQGRRIILSAML